MTIQTDSLRRRIRHGSHGGPSCILAGVGVPAPNSHPAWRFSQMRLSWRRSSGAEDRFEAWITKRHQRRVLAGETTPVGPCPDEAFLRDLAQRSKRVSFSDPRVDHSATCPTCMSRLLELRQKIHLRRRKLVLAAVVASCLVVTAALIAITRYRVHEQLQAANMAVVSQTVKSVGRRHDSRRAARSIAICVAAGWANQGDDYPAAFQCPRSVCDCRHSRSKR